MPQRQFLDFNISFPKQPPHKQVGEYLTSLKACRHVQLPGSGWDKASSVPELTLVSERRKYARVVEALEARREAHKLQKVQMENQWKEIENLERSFKANISNLNNFIKTNEEKRKRAIERKKEDEKMVEYREEQIEKLKQKIALVEQGKGEIEREIQSHHRYESYLKAVLGNTDEFKNPDQLVDRYEALMTTRRELGDRQNTALEHLENAKSQMARFAEDCSHRLLALQNILSSFQERHQMAKRNALQWESLVCSIRSCVLQKYREIVEVKQGCYNVYRLMCIRKGELPRIPEEDTEKQFLFIKRTLQLLQIMKKKAKAKNAKSFGSTKGQDSKAS